MDSSWWSAKTAYMTQGLACESVYAVLQQNKLHLAAGYLDHRIHGNKLRLHNSSFDIHPTQLNYMQNME
jgi:hypothetical protein